MLATLLKKGGANVSTPCSKITFYKVPQLNNSYRDSYYFSNVTDQNTFFAGNSLHPKELTGSQVTRISNNQVKVPYPSSEMIEYNYMCIINGRYNESSTPTGKPFYCFINNVEYVSDMCSLITFEVDVIQTYIPNVATLKDAYVERCHSDSDNYFENRVPEPFDFNVFNGIDEVSHTSVFYVVMGIASGTTIPDASGTDHVTTSHYLRFGNDGKTIYSGSEFWIFNPKTAGDRTHLTNIIDRLTHDGKIESITDFYCVPQDAYWETTDHIIESAPSTGVASNFDMHSLAPSDSNKQLDGGCIPDNKKLYCYPYCFLRILNNTGDYMDLKWEEFNQPVSGNKYQGAVCGSWFGGGQACFIPKDYEYSASDQPFLLPTINRNYVLPLSGFPNCPVANDTYSKWSAQNAVSGTVSNVIGASVGVIAAGAISAVAPAVGAIAGITAGTSFIKNMGNMVADSIKADKEPNTGSNAQTNPILPISNGLFGFTAVKMSLPRKFLEIIDDYFTMFGYAQKKIMNVRTYLNNSKRSKFCYIKTEGFNVQGNIPTIYKNKINDIFNSGITFWKTTATVGDYSNNDIVP